MAPGGRAARRKRGSSPLRGLWVACSGAAALLAAGPCTVGPFRRVLLVSATHGNEFTGAWVSKRLERLPHLAERPSIEEFITVQGNPEAYKAGVRFLDTDLNRQFKCEDLANTSLNSRESRRAKELNERFGCKAQSGEAVDFVIDLHTTTTSMGVAYIVEGFSNVSLAAAAWCQQRLQPLEASGELPPVRILREGLSREASAHVISICEHGVMIEVGPVPQGVLQHDACTWTETAIMAVLDFLQALNTGTLETPQRAVVYDDMNVKVAAPVGPDGKPTAIFHRDFQGRDFAPMRKGDPMFIDLDGEVISYDGRHGDEIWPVFVNEGGYYLPQSGLGFGVSLRREIDVPTVSAPSVPAPRGAADIV